MKEQVIVVGPENIGKKVAKILSEKYEAQSCTLIAPINIEGKLNTMHFKKGWKRRFIVREIDGTLHISLSNNGLVFVQALYMIKERKLYGISGVFQIHWASIKRIFKEEFDNIEIIGHIL